MFVRIPNLLRVMYLHEDTLSSKVVTRSTLGRLNPESAVREVTTLYL